MATETVVPGDEHIEHITRPPQSLWNRILAEPDRAPEYIALVAAERFVTSDLQERETRLLEDLAAYPPPYLLAELGQPPTNRDGLAAWLRGALAIERHRAAYLIYDRERAFGSGVSVGRFEQPGRRQDQERVQELVDDARRAITESLTRELDQELPGLDEAIGA